MKIDEISGIIKEFENIDVELISVDKITKLMHQLAYVYLALSSLWQQAETQARMLSDSKHEMFAQLCLKNACKTNAESERITRTSSEWLKFKKGMLEAENKARQLKVRRESARVLWETARSILSTKKNEYENMNNG